MMAGIAHIYGLTRHVGKPTSGRYVYRCKGGWYWQCDLHDGVPDPLPEQYGRTVATMHEAFAGALAHSKTCVPYFAARITQDVPNG